MRYTSRLLGRTELVDSVAGIGTAGWSALAAAPFIGSFLGVLVQRLPEGRPMAWGRSRCEHCGTVLAARDLVPFVSWLAARGRCRFCGQPLGWFYPAIEFAAVAVALLAVASDQGEAVWLDCVLGWWLLALGWIDLRQWLLPDGLTLPLVIAGLASAALLDPEQLTDRVLGAALGYLGLRLIANVYRAWRGREGLGQGDAKLLAASGAWIGASALPQVIFGAAALALLVVAGLRLAGVRLAAHSALPFGPFLALATWLIWVFGPFFVVM
jgi:leader peptidase (prepilin peptidase) / N-methyltransferase